MHTPFVHPIVMAKHLATMDHIGPGRVGVNIVSGWDREEFEMFGIPLREHDERYEYHEGLAGRDAHAWTADEPGDHRGKFFDLPGLIGAEAAGQDHPDERGHVQRWPGLRGRALRSAVQYPRLSRGVPGRGREGQGGGAPRGSLHRRVHDGLHRLSSQPEEAEEYHDYYSREMADWPATDHLMQLLGMDCQSFSPEFYAMFRNRFAAAHGHYVIVGDPGHVAQEIRRIRDTGVRGLTLGFIDFASEFSHFKDEVMPRLVDMGVRRPPG